ncbi:MAG: FmdB family zinc ribbon protein [Methylocystaceae bacterium]
MPTYDYRCEECGTFDVKQRITEDALTICPTCGGEIKRIISKNVGIVFKGSGFYCTDNQKAKAKQLNAERQVDNEALLDGDVGSYIETADATDKKVADL